MCLKYNSLSVLASGFVFYHFRRSFGFLRLFLALGFVSMDFYKAFKKAQILGMADLFCTHGILF